MATITPHGKGWRAQVRRKGHPALSATFPRKGQARAWAAAREAEILAGRVGLPAKHTLREAFERFAGEVAPKRRGARWEILRLRALGRARIASKLVGELTADDVARWRDARLLEVSAGTVAREMNLLAAVFGVMVREWRWLRESPARGVRKPKEPPARRRGLSSAEIDGVVAALGYCGGRPDGASGEVAVAFLLAIETGMRSGELMALRWPEVHRLHAHLPETKNGEARDVPLSRRARALIKALRGRDPERVFTVSNASRDAMFRAARERAGLSGFTFHDSRSEAIRRLAKRLTVLELARMVGHRDIRSLMFYYRDSPEDVAAKLG